jgi:DNA-binding MarR family transcriptional regulator
MAVSNGATSHRLPTAAICPVSGSRAWQPYRRRLRAGASPSRANRDRRVLSFRLPEQIIFTVYLHSCMNPTMTVAPDIHHARRASDLAQGLRALLGKLKRRLREQAGVGDLTPSQVSVLLCLERDGPATASSLARAEGMRPQSIAPVIAALENAGLVSGAPDPTDGRQTLLSLTDACRKLVSKGRAARQDWLARTIEARLSTREQDELLAALELLERLVDDGRRSRSSPPAGRRVS